MKFMLGVIFAALLGSLIAIGARSALSTTPEPSPAEVAPESPLSPLPSSAPDAPSVPPPAYSGPGFAATPLPERVVWVDGVMMRGRKVWAFLSDGRVFREDTEGLTRVDGEGLVIDGTRIWMRPVGLTRSIARLNEFKTNESPTPGARLADSLSSAPFESRGPESSWRMDPDGVQRLIAPGSIGGR